MNQIVHQYPLLTHNTFGLHSVAEAFFPFDHVNHLQSLIQDKVLENMPYHILGGGSNVLLKEMIVGLVIQPCMNQIEIVKKTNDYWIVKADAGVVWDDLVAWCVERNLYGLENLSYIPGSAGASPVQNIGAYGVEVAQFIYRISGCDLLTGEMLSFAASECEFGYRTSIFKTLFKGRFLITEVQFILRTSALLVVDYGDVKAEAEKLNGGITLQNIRQAITAIRKRKLPDPAEKGNAGSFFKNPVIEMDVFNRLIESYPSIPHYKQGESSVKIPAGWLIEQAGWKGNSLGRAAVHQNQALVLVNQGDARLGDVLKLADKIIEDVNHKFGISLEREVNILG